MSQNERLFELNEIPPETSQEAARVFLLALEYLDTLELQLPRLQRITTRETPSSVLAYLLYEDRGQQDSLIAFNPLQSVLLMDRGVTVLQGQ